MKTLEKGAIGAVNTWKLQINSLNLVCKGWIKGTLGPRGESEELRGLVLLFFIERGPQAGNM